MTMKKILNNLLKKPHLPRCSVVRLCDAIPIAPPRSLPRALHLSLFQQTVKAWAGTVVLMAVALAMSVPAAAFYDVTPMDRSREDYGAGATRKLGRGVANAGLGWMELFKGVQDVGEENGFWAGATWGPIYGTLNAVRRTAVGVYETATFPIASHGHFEPVLEPEFVLQDSK
jgi:putative exosortase-associated protein (TIGR04073 family)